ncbi:hypothetical protein DFJ67_3004 [Asanoa ferruginea]|uniref:Uncharacterized protein n=1 Tax=Asanoa ferruginea TaxID=53367 RepID=A0A3D9ZJI4_9ACTN|nr:hypothetical protein [Asanoa ferruginea]REF97009.1 hypothetical protein DFJ67_3004 [Asanoa ferruginea]GIF50199.1 hypothetical protein Afe04nite_47380 [Asanoa ferruginea]
MPDPVAELYAAPPDGFIVARDELVANAKAAGQSDRAKQLGKLRKPTVAAWVVNLLAIRRPELIDQLVELSAALRSAQRELKGDALRELTKQRREAVGALVKEAVTLATKTDPRNRGKLPVGEVEATLTAAVSDAEVAHQLRSGRLVRAASYAGFGEVPRPQLRLVTDEPPEPEPADETDERGSRRAADAQRAAQRKAADRELAAARSAEKASQAELDKATKAEADGAAAVEEAEAALQEAERRRADADAALGQLRVARKAAERAAVQARRRVGEVEAAIEGLDEA